MPAIDWEAATREATSLLREYLRIDTSNPPGNEALAVDFLAGLLTAEGIPFETAESAPGRANLIARIGPPSDTVCLLNHTDVVPVERRFWDIDPFGGELKDGYIWGRGALDMKSMGIIELMTFITLKRQGVPLRRGVTFLAVADEEAASEFGVTWIAENRPGWMNDTLVINEGAYGLTNFGGKDTPLFQIAPSEKIPVWLQLRSSGRPGHGSVPHGDNCADHLVHALERISNWKQELRVTPVLQEHLNATAAAGLITSPSRSEAAKLAERNLALRARMSNTISLTTINTGIKVNVIPAEATATLDCRLLPDVSPHDFLEQVQNVIDDDRVEVEIINRLYEGNASPMDHEFAFVVRDVIGEFVEGAKLAPELMTGFTDSRIYRTRGTAAYGFVPCLLPVEELAGVHGHNERISVENLRLGMQILYEVVRRLCS